MHVLQPQSSQGSGSHTCNDLHVSAVGSTGSTLAQHSVLSVATWLVVEAGE